MITAEIVSKEEYQKVFEKVEYCFDSVEFHQTVAQSVNELLYVLFKKDNKNKAGVILGVKEKELKLHYSAPFGCIESVKGHLKIEEYEEIIDLIEDIARKKGMQKIFIRIPPMFYSLNELGKLVNILYRKEFIIEELDLNYALQLKTKEKYIVSLQRNARKNLNTALKNDLQMIRCESLEEKKLAYEVIKSNRENKGYPLRMTWEHIQNTIQYVENDFFLVRKKEDNIAAAMIFHVNTQVVQVVYWGDIREYAEQRPINYLAYMLNNLYYQQGFKFMDIGPSTEDGVPNYGLCDFKESIGCQVDIKYTFIKQVRE